MSRNILIVDDEDDIREVAQLALEMTTSWRVRTARSGAEALELAARERPDAILLDVMMPGLDGPGTLARLREQPPTADIPVILLTAKVQPSDRRRFEGLGVAAVLAKPFDPMALAAEVGRALGWSA